MNATNKLFIKVLQIINITSMKMAQVNLFSVGLCACFDGFMYQKYKKNE